jgi:thioredoxin reductase (NADPH)
MDIDRRLDGAPLDGDRLFITARDITIEESEIAVSPRIGVEGAVAAAHWPLTRPPRLLETSLPGVFAVGDVRCGNIKRVASAVGEGSIAVSFVHQALHE